MRTTYWVEHRRIDCDEEFEFAAPHPTEADRDAHAEILCVEAAEQPGVVSGVRTFETIR